MFYWDHAYPSPEANLAFDEAILEAMDTGESPSAGETGSLDDPQEWELLRLWEMPHRCVVIGRSSKIAQEVHVESCRRDGIPVLRRMSGGASIVAGPGCLMFSLLISLNKRPSCRALDEAHREVMGRVREAVQAALVDAGLEMQVAIQGVCDLTIGNRKISGNALRIKRHWMMYHGTVLVNMPLEWISEYLATPPKRPEYRGDREHSRFVTSLAEQISQSDTTIERLRESIAREMITKWQAHRGWHEHPFAAQADQAVSEWMIKRYANAAWHAQR